MNNEDIRLEQIKGGWAAYGDWWAVHGETREDAIRLYHEAVVRHDEIARRLRERAISEVEQPEVLLVAGYGPRT